LLVLGRKKSQSIKIGKEIEVKILDVDPHSLDVRVGITAPKELNIVRAELTDGTKKERGSTR